MLVRMATLAALGAGLLLTSGRVLAQPSLPSTFFGSVSIDGKPPPDGSEVRGFVNGRDCTQPGARGTLTESGVGLYLIHVMHDSQQAGCGKEVNTVTFTIAGRQAGQSATWRTGPQQLDLNAGSGNPAPLPPATATPRGGTSPATPSGSGQASGQSAGQPGAVGSGAAAPTQALAGQNGDTVDNAGNLAANRPNDSGGWPFGLVLLGGLAVVGVAGGAGGVVLSRRRSRRPKDDA